MQQTWQPATFPKIVETLQPGCSKPSSDSPPQSPRSPKESATTAEVPSCCACQGTSFFVNTLGIGFRSPCVFQSCSYLSCPFLWLQGLPRATCPERITRQWVLQSCGFTVQRLQNAFQSGLGSLLCKHSTSVSQEQTLLPAAQPPAAIDGKKLQVNVRSKLRTLKTQTLSPRILGNDPPTLNTRTSTKYRPCADCLG